MAPVYATPEQLAEYLGVETAPEGAQRALEDASLDVDNLLIGAVYAVDGEGAPTEQRVIDALRRAVLYQVVHGSPELVGGRKRMPEGMRLVRIGQMSYTAATDPATGRVVWDRMSTRAVSVLRVEGLLPTHPITW